MDAGGSSSPHPDLVICDQDPTTVMFVRLKTTVLAGARFQ